MKNKKGIWSSILISIMAFSISFLFISFVIDSDNKEERKEQICKNQCVLNNMSFYDYSFSSRIAPRACLCKDENNLIKQLYTE